MIEAAVQDADPPVGEGPKSSSMGLAFGAVGVVVAPGAGRGAERAERPHLQRIGEASVAGKAGQGDLRSPPLRGPLPGGPREPAAAVRAAIVQEFRGGLGPAPAVAALKRAAAPALGLCFLSACPNYRPAAPAGADLGLLH